MTTQRLLLNMNRNSTRLDALFMQITSGKIIQNPSDNPIIASRALRFRTNVTEIEQFSRNVDQAISWMEVSEQNLQNMTNIFTTQRSELLVQGASSTYTFQNRQTIVRVVELLFQQTQTELNGTFAGRYLFSGFRTDLPPIMTANELNRPTTELLEVRKTLDRGDIHDQGAVFWRDPDNNLHVVVTHEWLYRPDRVPADWETNPDSEITITVLGDPPTTWTQPDNPLVAPPPLNSNGINIVRLPYNQTAQRDMEMLTFPGFNVVRTYLDGTTVPTMPGTDPVNPYVVRPTDPLSDPPINPALPTIHFIPETGELVIHSDDLALFNSGVNIEYTLDGVFQGELNPKIFFDTIDHASNIHYTQDNQEIRFEVGTNVRLTINTQARDAYPWQLFADMSSLIHWVNNVQTSPSPPATAEEVARETAFFSEMLHTKFTNIMDRMDSHMQITTTEYAALGSRMERMEMIENRLLENRDTFRALRDQNENIDYLEILMQLNAAEAVFQAAMQVGARITQLSLVNYI
jgi:flagellar hook-associated protein 3 FlgL